MGLLLMEVNETSADFRILMPNFCDGLATLLCMNSLRDLGMLFHDFDRESVLWSWTGRPSSYRVWVIFRYLKICSSAFGGRFRSRVSICSEWAQLLTGSGLWKCSGIPPVEKVSDQRIRTITSSYYRGVHGIIVSGVLNLAMGSCVVTIALRGLERIWGTGRHAT